MAGNGALELTGPDGQTTRHELRTGSTILGRDAEADLRLDVEGVSRQHARIITTPDRCVVIDMGSTNGIFLNNVRIKANVPQPLRDGDTLRMGRQTARYLAPQRLTVPPEVQRRVPVAAPDAAPPPPPPTQRAARTLHIPLREGQSSYMELLPAPYQTDAASFLNRFLLIFESVLSPLDRTIGQLPRYLDPQVVPETMLPWLASWLALVLNERWPIAARRELLAAAADLYRWRGTRRGLSAYLQIYTGVAPTILEPGIIAGATRDTALPAHTFRVLLTLPPQSHVERELVEAIIESEKPAHTTYTLEIVAAR